MIGHSSYRLLSFEPKELGLYLQRDKVPLKPVRRIMFYDSLLIFWIRSFYPLSEVYYLEKGEKYVVQKRQRFFWFYGLPLFPVGTFWCIRTERKKQFEYPAVAYARLPLEKDKFIFPWRSFFLPILALLSLLCFGVYYYVDEWQERERDKENHIASAKIIQGQIDSAARGDFYLFELADEENGERSYGGNTVMMVTKADKDFVTLVSRSTDLVGDNAFSYGGLSDFERIFSDSTLFLKTCRVKRTDLSKIIARRNFFSYEDALVIPAIDTKRPLLLTEIKKKAKLK